MLAGGFRYDVLRIPVRGRAHFFVVQIILHARGMEVTDV